MSSLFKNALLTCFAAILCCACLDSDANNAVSSEAIDGIKITSFPKVIDKDCRNGRAKIYDECSSQSDLFAQAKVTAKAEGKTLLVSYGAEWCIWCHVFDAYINGKINKFTYTYGEAGNDERVTHTMRERAKQDQSQEAFDVKNYVSENFVIVHIDYEHSPDGDDVLSKANAWDYHTGGVPYIFVVNDDGKYAAQFDHDAAEVRRDTDDWYRGYDRVQFLKQLKDMRNLTAVTQDSPG